MNSTIQARLDEGSKKALAELTRKLGWSPSRIIREGLQLLAACYVGSGGKKIVGMGKFASGQPDLGADKKHLRGFGR